MKWILIITMLLALVVLSGCVSANYNAETKEASYFRLGNQEVDGFEVILADGSSVSFEKQKSETAILAEIIERLIK